MSFQNFIKEIEKKLPSPLYLLNASDPFLLREAADAIKGLVPAEEREFTLSVFDAAAGKEEFSLQQIPDVANSFSFFMKRRFVILENLQKIPQKDLKILEEYLGNPSPDTVLVFLHEGQVKKGFIEGYAKLKCISLDIREADIPAWLKQRARKHGIVLSDQVIDYLVGFIGAEFGILSSEIEKMSMIGKKDIQIEDISGIVTGGGACSPFALYEALNSKDADEVLWMCKTLKESTEIYSLIGVLNWQFGRNLSSLRKAKGNAYCAKAFGLLNTADIDTKSSGRNYPVEYLLIRLLRLEATPEKQN